MAYVPTDWAVGDVISEGKLDKIEGQLTALSDGSSFQLCGKVGGASALEIPAGAKATFQQLAVLVPVGKRLVLERARYAVPGAGELRLRVEGYPVGAYDFTSAGPEGDESPNAVLADAAGGAGSLVRLEVRVYNPSAGPLDVFPYAGWWLGLALVHD